MVVVNAESADSLAVANHYIDLRDIPATNVVYVSGVTTTTKSDDESSSSKAYQSQILDPVLKTMSARGLEGQIDCIAFSAGFPTRINFHPQLKKYLKQAGKKYNIQLHAPWASISSLTYFHKNAFSDTPDFLELDANRYAPLRLKGISENPFDGQTATEFDKAVRSIKNRDYSGAEKKLLKLAREHPNQMAVLYAVARAYASNGNAEKAIQTLSNARARGFAHQSVIKKDSAFRSLKGNQDFEAVMDQMENLPANFVPTRSFSAKSYWAKNGWANGRAGQGERYMLSTVLAVTGKGRSTVSQALAQLSSSVAADGTQPEDLVYFAKHGDPRSKTRQSQFSAAVAELKALNRNITVGTGKLPPKGSKIVGATLGSPVLAWKSSGCQFAPGALCDNFTSYGGLWAKSSQTQLSEHLNAGAAGACGTVYEPYTISPKIPNARLHAHYARGSTLAEAFYQSVSGPFQLLIVGDPLCCPFGNFPKFEVAGASLANKVQGDFELNIKADDQGPAIRHFDVFHNGALLSNVGTSKTLRVSTDDMDDGYHELRVVGIADTPVANRTSRSIEFVLDKRGHSTTLVAEKSRVRLNERLVLTAESSTGSEIEIRQNSRVIARTNNGIQKSIAASRLGLGKSRLLAVVRAANGGTVRSIPLEVEIVH